MQVTLHIGAHRTATTTLQKVFALNQKALSVAGVASLGPRALRKGFLVGLMQPPRENSPFKDVMQRRAMAKIDFTIERLRAERYRHLVLSEENSIGPVRRSLVRRRLYPQAGPRLTQLAPVLAPHVTQVALSIRCYDAWWTSALAFGMARGLKPPTSEDLEAMATQPRSWRDLITVVRGVFPDARIHVWTFETLAARPERVIAALTGASPSLKGIRDWNNSAATPGALATIVSRRGGDGLAIDPSQRRYMPFTDAQRAIMRKDYAEDLEWLRSGADGQARLIDAPAPDAGLARGWGNVRDTRRVAQAGRGRA